MIPEMKLPDFVTHYFESDYGPYLNVCDLDEVALARLTTRERTADTAFNRFAMGPVFFEWRRAADDLLIRAYREKFGFAPAGRPFYALLGEFDKTLTMFREGRKMTLRIDDFSDHEMTFMYPDHAHLTSYYRSGAPDLFCQPSAETSHYPFWGKLFTYQELCSAFGDLGLDSMIATHKAQDRWVGCYVEAHLWKRELRTRWEEESGLTA